MKKKLNISVVLFFSGFVLFIMGILQGNSQLISSIFFVISGLLAGYHIIGEGFEDTYQDTKRNRKFTPNIHLLMTLAALGSALIGSFEEAALLILIFAAAHFLEDYAQGKSQREITKLLNLNPTQARLVVGNQIKIVPVEELKIGDRIQVLNGDQIPTDGAILEGSTSVDESSINGESVPKEKKQGDLVFGSTINGTGTIVVEVTKDSSETVFAKIIQLVKQSQENQSEIASKIKRFEPKYVKAVLIAFPLVVLFSFFVSQLPLAQSFYRGLVFLISASPCALAASAVPATLSGISNLAKQGVLFKGGAYLANLADIKALAFDKTGTLTQGKPKVTDYYLVNDLPESKAELLDILVNMEKKSNHPLARAILDKFEDQMKELNLEVENVIGVGLVTQFSDASFRIGKPSSFAVVPQEVEEKTKQLSNEGKTVVYFAKNDQIIGWVALMDVPRKESIDAMSYFKNQGIRTTMITGDAKLTGEAVGKIVGVEQVFANVLPEEKSQIIDQLKRENGIVGMVGDGINDAPALVKADIGVAMGDGTDVAIDVADVVIMQNDLEKLSYAHQVSKRLNQIVQQNIIFSMSVVGILILLNFFGISNISFSVLIHEGSTLVVIFNGLRLLAKLKTNNSRR
ncbi:heavy metal translocating P-type ATPase [Vagococcus entomophilus]|uniref:Heavy metal translocating P-type ATPase n=1 Tax=Vagococcus entomophilus TaxID=1160095 RepID=A0A430AGN9_9ENTE|nr:heavy metal translocating P-type ATPase [Vagococcus entomophilus]RSU07075.1 heavy metal translocating P-type ATPase [Vagococcus entomophilus]